MIEGEHTALDAIIAAAALWDEIEHNPAISSDTKLAETAQHVSELIGAFYQQAGRALLDEERKLPLHAGFKEEGS